MAACSSRRLAVADEHKRRIKTIILPFAMAQIFHLKEESIELWDGEEILAVTREHNSIGSFKTLLLPLADLFDYVLQ